MPHRVHTNEDVYIKLVELQTKVMELHVSLSETAITSNMVLSRLEDHEMRLRGVETKAANIRGMWLVATATASAIGGSAFWVLQNIMG